MAPTTDIYDDNYCHEASVSCVSQAYVNVDCLYMTAGSDYILPELDIKKYTHTSKQPPIPHYTYDEKNVRGTHIDTNRKSNTFISTHVSLLPSQLSSIPPSSLAFDLAWKGQTNALIDQISYEKITLNIDINMPNSQSETLMYVAALCGYEVMLRTLATKGARVDRRCQDNALEGVKHVIKNLKFQEKLREMGGSKLKIRVGKVPLRPGKDRDRGIYPTEMYHLRQILSGQCSSENVSLVRRKLNTNEMDLFFDFLECENHVTSIDIRKIGLGSHGTDRFSRMLITNKKLLSAFLFDNQIGDQGLQKITKSLLINNRFSKINLCQNGIGPIGAGYLAYVVATRSSLVHIDINNNHIGDQGAEEFSHALRSNTTLKELSMWNNGITDKGACMIINALKFNSEHGLVKMNLRSGGANSNTVSHSNLVEIETLLVPKMQGDFLDRLDKDEEGATWLYST